MLIVQLFECGGVEATVLLGKLDQKLLQTRYAAENLHRRCGRGLLRRLAPWSSASLAEATE